MSFGYFPGVAFVTALLTSCASDPAPNALTNPGVATMTANRADVEIGALVERSELASKAFMRGDATEYLNLSTEQEDFTIFGPFGGPALKGRAAFSVQSPAIAANFASGDAKVHLLQSYASGELLVLVLDEEQHAVIGQQGDRQPWSLRVTQVYRREGGEWRVVHRHADPLTRRRSVSDAKILAK